MRNKIENKKEVNNVKSLEKSLINKYIKNSKILKNGKQRG